MSRKTRAPGSPGTGLAVAAAGADDQIPARELSLHLKLPLLPWEDIADRNCPFAVALVVQRGSLLLQQTGRDAPGPVAVDFGSAGMRHRRRAGHNELLGRAVGVAKRPGLRLLDATAGLGRDSFVLADLGAEVIMCERNAVVARLLQSGLDEARKSADPWLLGAVSRLRLFEGDARQLPLEELSDVAVIYLDPMFPARGKSAAVKKEMALFQWLLDSGEADDSEQLLSWALATAVPRVVVKRPPRSEFLAGVDPSHSIAGKAVRYDVYVKHGPEQS